MSFSSTKPFASVRCALAVLAAILLVSGLASSATANDTATVDAWNAVRVQPSPYAASYMQVNYEFSASWTGSGKSAVQSIFWMYDGAFIKNVLALTSSSSPVNNYGTVTDENRSGGWYRFRVEVQQSNGSYTASDQETDSDYTQ